MTNLPSAPCVTPSKYAPKLDSSPVTRTLVLPEHLLPVQLFGAHDEVLRTVEQGFPAVTIHVRDTTIRLTGVSAQVETVELLLCELIDVAATGTPLGSAAVKRAIALLAAAAHPVDVLATEVLTTRTKTVRPQTLGQKTYTDAIANSTITFGIGPAGTGKTYLAMASAVDALMRKQVSRIILTRPAVEAGENLGFLPGTLTDKIDPYLRPLYDALRDMLADDSFPRLLEAGTIEVAPLAFMRGRTLNNSFIILDEAQNTTAEQMKMFLTRLGFGSKMVVTGDLSQVDLPAKRQGGLQIVRSVLEGVEDVAFCELSAADVVRHNLVGRIIEAYANYEAAQAALPTKNIATFPSRNNFS